MILKPCSDKDAFNAIAKIEQSLTIKDSIKAGELIMKQGSKVDVVIEIIKIIEFYLKITGKELEIYQVRVLAGDLYDKFRTDTVEDLILFFKMIRTGDLGKLKYYDNFHDKIMSYVPQYFQYKSEQREKMIEAKKKQFKKKADQTQMSEEAYNKFTELQNRISNPIQRSAEIFSVKGILSSIDNYIEKLPETCKKLSDSDLKYEIQRTQFSNKTAYEILLQEQEHRKTTPKKKKKNE
ncbi:hypothetical protein DBR39_13665 [Chryseobacterium sp. KBW03]|nr:hypothetical protein DBR39_13665 [Chryseobacterium sp. KBW03]